VGPHRVVDLLPGPQLPVERPDGPEEVLDFVELLRVGALRPLDGGRAGHLDNVARPLRQIRVGLPDSVGAWGPGLAHGYPGGGRFAQDAPPPKRGEMRPTMDVETDKPILHQLRPCPQRNEWGSQHDADLVSGR